MAHDPWAEVRAEAHRLVAAAEESLGLPPTPTRFEEPPEGMGDVAVPAFAYSKAARRAPTEIARDLARAMPPSPWFPKVEAAGAYVNLSVDPARFAELTLGAIAERGEAYGSSPPNGRRVLLEHTSVNPTGPLHVGRARNALIGDALARVLRRAEG